MNLKQHDVKLLKIALILALSLFIIGCDRKIPEFPSIQYIYEVDAIHEVCGEYEVISMRPFKVKFKQDLHIAACNGNISLKMQDFKKIMNWKQDVEDWCESSKFCKNKML